ncbi:Serine/threonine-protein kinase PBL34-like protein [Drosera capensis]
MGCFTVLKSKKKKNKQVIHANRVLPQEQTPTTLPEPPIHNHRLQSAPPSFCNRVNPSQQAFNKSGGRTRTLSDPSNLHGSEQDFPSIELEEHELLKSHGGITKEQRCPSPQPLPLPSPQSAVALKTIGSFKSVNTSGPLYASGPLPLPPSGLLRSFSYDEIASACHNFSLDHCTSEGLSSTVYKASVCEAGYSSKRLEVTVTCFYPPIQTLKEFVSEANTLASLQHPNLCKLIGYHAREHSEQKIMVYERLHHGSLDRFLYGRSDGPPLDWNSRMRVALCAAQGLTYLHEEGPFQAMYDDFSAANIQIDKDFSAKLSGYGCVGCLPEGDWSNSSGGMGNLSVETVERGLLTPKSNVFSFGIVLLELLTGRRNLDSSHPKEERNIVKWSRPFLSDDGRLTLIMDPQLKGRFPIKAARLVADIAQKCLQRDPSERPTMRTVVDSLKSIQEIKYSCLFPLQEPTTVIGKQMQRSPSLNGTTTNLLLSMPSFSKSSPLSGQPATPLTRMMTMPMPVRPRSSFSALALSEVD